MRHQDVLRKLKELRQTSNKPLAKNVADVHKKLFLELKDFMEKDVLGFCEKGIRNYTRYGKKKLSAIDEATDAEYSEFLSEFNSKVEESLEKIKNEVIKIKKLL